MRQQGHVNIGFLGRIALIAAAGEKKTNLSLVAAFGSDIITAINRINYRQVKDEHTTIHIYRCDGVGGVVSRLQ